MPHEFFAARQSRVHSRGQHALGQIVSLVETTPLAHHQNAFHKQLFQRLFGRTPIEPAATLSIMRMGEVARGLRATAPYLGQNAPAPAAVLGGLLEPMRLSGRVQSLAP